MDRLYFLFQDYATRQQALDILDGLAEAILLNASSRQCCCCFVNQGFNFVFYDLEKDEVFQLSVLKFVALTT